MIAHCRDFRRVKKLTDWDINISSEIFYLIEVDRGVDVGVWGLHPYENGLMIHASMGPACRGKKAATSALGVFEWVFDNTNSETVFGVIPAELRHVCFLARHVGMAYGGTDEDGARLYQITRSAMAMNKRKAA